MVTPKLGAPHHLEVAAAAVLATTLAASALAVIDPTVAGSTAPHPALTGSLSDWVAIAAENLRVLAIPYLLWLLGVPTSRPGRRAGDGAMLIVIALNAIPVGIELGRWRDRLLPYVPQLPLEWAALIVAVSAWLTIRTGTATLRHVALLAGGTAVLVLAAASLETWVTPHRPRQTASQRLSVDSVQEGPRSCGCPGVAFATDFAPARPGRFKVARSLPLAPLGSARPNTGADRAPSTTPGPPQGGTTR